MTSTILNNAEDLGAFRLAVRDWLEAVSPKDWAQRMATATPAEYEAFHRWWMAERNKVGLAIPHWPKEYGGADLSLKHQAIVAEEMARARAPYSKMYTVSFNHILPTLLAWGTQAQRTRYLPGIGQGEVWCQGFSEPGAGSDLAALRTRAVREGDHFVINGQKIWSSNSTYARYCILLARTSTGGRKQEGITYFIMDMQAPGVEVRPIRQSTGHAEFAELFLTDVRIPVEDVVGPVDQGWTVAQTTLASERGVLALERSERQRYVFEADIAEAVQGDGAWLRDDQLRREFMKLFGEMQAGRRMVRDVLAESEGSHHGFSMTPSIVKLTETTLRQRFHELRVRQRGLESQAFVPAADDGTYEPLYEYIHSFSTTISAGSNEIMRNIIAERGLGMPR